jgi:hypothetical protein
MYLVVIVYSMWSLYGVYVESTWSSHGVPTQMMTNLSLHRLHIDSMWSLQVQVGECKVLPLLNNYTLIIILDLPIFHILPSAMSATLPMCVPCVPRFGNIGSPSQVCPMLSRAFPAILILVLPHQRAVIIISSLPRPTRHHIV